MRVAISLCSVLSYIYGLRASWLSTIHGQKFNSGKSPRETTTSFIWKTFESLATHSHGAQSKQALPICQMEWFKGVFPSWKPANQQLLGDLSGADQGARS